MVMTMYLDADGSRESDERMLEVAIDQSLTAGQLGFNPWYTEHHFRGPWHSAPLQFAAYIAPLLPRERYLGFGVLSVPYHHPVRLVEQMNLLDQLTKGHVLFGLGSGFPGIEPASAGLPEEYHQSGSAARESLDVMQRLWDFDSGDEPYEFATAVWSGRITKRIVPSPYRRHRPTIIRTARRDESAVTAARRGWPAFLGTFGSDLPSQSRLYRQELSAAGHPADVVQECLRWSTVDWLTVLVAETDEQASELLERAVAERMALRDKFLAREGPVYGPAAIKGASGLKPSAFSSGGDMLGAICGGPDTVAAEVQRVADHGINHLLLRFIGEWHGETRPIAEQSMRLFSEEVMPRFLNRTPTHLELADETALS